jgi:hypothetical protein
MSSFLLEEQAKGNIEEIRFSINIICRCIQNLSADTEHELLVMRFKSCQREASGMAVLLMCYGNCHQNKVEEYILFCKSLESHIAGEQIIKLVDFFMIDINSVGNIVLIYV